MGCIKQRKWAHGRRQVSDHTYSRFTRTSRVAVEARDLLTLEEYRRLLLGKTTGIILWPHSRTRSSIFKINWTRSSVRRCLKRKRVYCETADHDPDEAKLFKLVFWLLTAKVFSDRRLKGFEGTLGLIQTLSGAAVAHHYKSERRPRLLTKDARTGCRPENLEAQMDFRNLSVEVLSHIWSTTLIDSTHKSALGYPSHFTHACSIYHRQNPICVSPGDDELIILEPCVGARYF